MEQLEPSEMLSSSTTILEAVELFGSRPNRYFYVIHVNEVTRRNCVLATADQQRQLSRA